MAGGLINRLLVIHEINRYCSSGSIVKVFIALTNLSFSDSVNGAVG